jgi:hypothetical protein
MLLIIPLVLVSLVVVLALWPHAFRRPRTDNLGTMSENWLAECNASRRTPPQ